MSLIPSINPDAVLTALVLLLVVAVYLAVGFVVLLATHRDDRVDRITRHWRGLQVQLTWALWPLSSPWLWWRARRG